MVFYALLSFEYLLMNKLLLLFPSNALIINFKFNFFFVMLHDQLLFPSLILCLVNALLITNIKPFFKVQLA